MISIYDSRTNNSVLVVCKRRFKRIKRKYYIKAIGEYSFTYETINKSKELKIILAEKHNNIDMIISNNMMHSIKHKSQSISYQSLNYVNMLIEFDREFNINIDSNIYIKFQTEKEYAKWKLKNDV